MRTLPLAALCLLLTGCGGETERDSATTQAQPARPTLGPLPARPASAGTGGHTDFHKAFTHGTVIDRPMETIHIEVEPVGQVHTTERGGMELGCPLAAHTAIPLPILAPEGAYSVDLSKVTIRAKDGSGQAEQIAAARLRLAPGQAVEWKWAGNFGSEGGVAAFMSPAAAEVLAQGESSPFYRRVTVASTRDGLVSGVLSSQEGAPSDIAWTHTGLGDGSFDVYVGLDADGAPVEVVADFQILLEPDELIVFLEAPAQEPPGIIPLAELDALGITVRRAHPGESTPLGGDPLWFEVDSRENRRNPALGFPEVVALDAEEREVRLLSGNAGFTLWIAVPPDAERIARLAIAVRTGFKPL